MAASTTASAASAPSTKNKKDTTIPIASQNESLCSRVLQTIGDYLCVLDDFEGECPRATEAFCDEIASLEELLLAVHTHVHTNGTLQDRSVTPILLTSTFVSALTGCAQYDERVGLFRVKYEFFAQWLKAIGTNLLRHCTEEDEQPEYERKITNEEWEKECAQFNKIQLLKTLEELIHQTGGKEEKGTGEGDQNQKQDPKLFHNALHSFKASSFRRSLLDCHLSRYILPSHTSQEDMNEIADIFKYKLTSSVNWLQSSLRLVCYRTCYVIAQLKSRLYADICELVSIDDGITAEPGSWAEEKDRKKLLEFEHFYTGRSALSSFDELLQSQLTTLGYKVCLFEEGDEAPEEGSEEDDDDEKVYEAKKKDGKKR